MNLKSIVFNNFKNFEGTHSFSFKKLNLVKGKNGAGKSTLIKDSFMFVFYGYSDTFLEKLPTRGKSKTCKVTINIGDYEITREYPTKLTILKSGVELDLANNAEKQRYLNELFNNIEYFKKFRMLDITSGINMLEQGKTALRKDLISFNEGVFNSIRQNLQNKKRDREIYNKDKAVISPYYPSEKRLSILEMEILDISEQTYSLEKNLNDLQSGLYKLESKKGAENNTKCISKSQQNKISQYSKCPTCKRNMDVKTKSILNEELKRNIEKANQNIGNLISQIEDEKDALEYVKSLKKSLIERKQKLLELKTKLEGRIKQKEYIYTTKDIIVMKEAINELDNFCSFYITQWIKNLEPIINSVLSKINFKVDFNINDKKDLEIKLFKDDLEYSYKDLSNGEKLILVTAFQLSVLLERGDSGIIIADEGFSSLDYDNLLSIFELFRELPFQLISVVHRLDNIPSGIGVISL